MARIYVKDKDFKISNVPNGMLLRAMRDVGSVDDIPDVAVWADMIACSLRRSGLAVQLTIL